MKNLVTQTGTSKASLTDRIQEIEETMSELKKNYKENVKSKNLPTQNI